MTPTTKVKTEGKMPDIETNTDAADENAAVDTNAAVAASVAVRLPDFWRNDPAMWFAQAEAQFALAGVVRDHTKFNHIVAKVDQQTICHIADLVTNPPLTNKYPAVKSRLISRFEMSPQGKLEQLLGSCDLGDMRPTHLLAKMQELSMGLNVNAELLKMLFLQRMPANVKAILAISDGSLTKLAEMADKMLESALNVAAVAANSGQPSCSSRQAVPTSDEMSTDDLREQVAFLTAEVRRMRTRSTSRSRSVSRSRNSAEEICWYHKKYGTRATRCREPCKFSKN